METATTNPGEEEVDLEESAVLTLFFLSQEEQEERGRERDDKDRDLTDHDASDPDVASTNASPAAMQNENNLTEGEGRGEGESPVPTPCNKDSDEGVVYAPQEGGDGQSCGQASPAPPTHITHPLNQHGETTGYDPIYVDSSSADRLKLPCMYEGRQDREPDMWFQSTATKAEHKGQVNYPRDTYIHTTSSPYTEPTYDMMKGQIDTYPPNQQPLVNHQQGHHSKPDYLNPTPELPSCQYAPAGLPPSNLTQPQTQLGMCLEEDGNSTEDLCDFLRGGASPPPQQQQLPQTSSYDTTGALCQYAVDLPPPPPKPQQYNPDLEEISDTEEVASTHVSVDNNQYCVNPQAYPGDNYPQETDYCDDPVAGYSGNELLEPSDIADELLSEAEAGYAARNNDPSLERRHSLTHSAGQGMVDDCSANLDMRSIKGLLEVALAPDGAQLVKVTPLTQTHSPQCVPESVSPESEGYEDGGEDAVDVAALGEELSEVANGSLAYQGIDNEDSVDGVTRLSWYQGEEEREEQDEVDAVQEEEEYEEEYEEEEQEEDEEEEQEEDEISEVFNKTIKQEPISPVRRAPKMTKVEPRTEHRRKNMHRGSEDENQNQEMYEPQPSSKPRSRRRSDVPHSPKNTPSDERQTSSDIPAEVTKYEEDEDDSDPEASPSEKSASNEGEEEEEEEYGETDDESVPEEDLEEYKDIEDEPVLAVPVHEPKEVTDNESDEEIAILDESSETGDKQVPSNEYRDIEDEPLEGFPLPEYRDIEEMPVVGISPGESEEEKQEQEQEEEEELGEYMDIENEPVAGFPIFLGAAKAVEQKSGGEEKKGGSAAKDREEAQKPVEPPPVDIEDYLEKQQMINAKVVPVCKPPRRRGRPRKIPPGDPNFEYKWPVLKKSEKISQAPKRRSSLKEERIITTSDTEEEQEGGKLSKKKRRRSVKDNELLPLSSSKEESEDLDHWVYEGSKGLAIKELIHNKLGDVTDDSKNDDSVEGHKTWCAFQKSYLSFISDVNGVVPRGPPAPPPAPPPAVPLKVKQAVVEAPRRPRGRPRKKRFDVQEARKKHGIKKNLVIVIPRLPKHVFHFRCKMFSPGAPPSSGGVDATKRNGGVEQSGQDMKTSVGNRQRRRSSLETNVKMFTQPASPTVISSDSESETVVVSTSKKPAVGEEDHRNSQEESKVKMPIADKEKLSQGTRAGVSDIEDSSPQIPTKLSCSKEMNLQLDDDKDEVISKQTPPDGMDLSDETAEVTNTQVRDSSVKASEVCTEEQKTGEIYSDVIHSQTEVSNTDQVSPVEEPTHKLATPETNSEEKRPEKPRPSDRQICQVFGIDKHIKVLVRKMSEDLIESYVKGDLREKLVVVPHRDSPHALPPDIHQDDTWDEEKSDVSDPDWIASDDSSSDEDYDVMKTQQDFQDYPQNKAMQVNQFKPRPIAPAPSKDLHPVRLYKRLNPPAVKPPLCAGTPVPLMTVRPRTILPVKPTSNPQMLASKIPDHSESLKQYLLKQAPPTPQEGTLPKRIIVAVGGSKVKAQQPRIYRQVRPKISDLVRKIPDQNPQVMRATETIEKRRSIMAKQSGEKEEREDSKQNREPIKLKIVKVGKDENVVKDGIKSQLVVTVKSKKQGEKSGKKHGTVHKAEPAYSILKGADSYGGEKYSKDGDNSPQASDVGISQNKESDNKPNKDSPETKILLDAELEEKSRAETTAGDKSKEVFKRENGTAGKTETQTNKGQHGKNVDGEIEGTKKEKTEGFSEKDNELMKVDDSLLEAQVAVKSKYAHSCGTKVPENKVPNTEENTNSKPAGKDGDKVVKKKKSARERKEKETFRSMNVAKANVVVQRSETSKVKQSSKVEGKTEDRMEGECSKSKGEKVIQTEDNADQKVMEKREKSETKSEGNGDKKAIKKEAQNGTKSEVYSEKKVMEERKLNSCDESKQTETSCENNSQQIKIPSSHTSAITEPTEEKPAKIPKPRKEKPPKSKTKEGKDSGVEQSSKTIDKSKKTSEKTKDKVEKDPCKPGKEKPSKPKPKVNTSIEPKKESEKKRRNSTRDESEKTRSISEKSLETIPRKNDNSLLKKETAAKETPLDETTKESSRKKDCQLEANKRKTPCDITDRYLPTKLETSSVYMSPELSNEEEDFPHENYLGDTTKVSTSPPHLPLPPPPASTTTKFDEKSGLLKFDIRKSVRVMIDRVPGGLATCRKKIVMEGARVRGIHDDGTVSFWALIRGGWMRGKDPPTRRRPGDPRTKKHLANIQTPTSTAKSKASPKSSSPSSPYKAPTSSATGKQDPVTAKSIASPKSSGPSTPHKTPTMSATGKQEPVTAETKASPKHSSSTPCKDNSPTPTPPPSEVQSATSTPAKPKVKRSISTPHKGDSPTPTPPPLEVQSATSSPAKPKVKRRRSVPPSLPAPDLPTDQTMNTETTNSDSPKPKPNLKRSISTPAKPGAPPLSPAVKKPRKNSSSKQKDASKEESSSTSNSPKKPRPKKPSKDTAAEGTQSPSKKSPPVGKFAVASRCSSCFETGEIVTSVLCPDGITLSCVCERCSNVKDNMSGSTSNAYLTPPQTLNDELSLVKPQHPSTSPPSKLHDFNFLQTLLDQVKRVADERSEEKSKESCDIFDMALYVDGCNYPDCEYHPTSLGDEVKHKWNVHEDCICETCNINFLLPEQLYTHLKLHKSDEMSYCMLCGESATNFFTHLLEKHGVTSCILCGLQVASEEHYEEHIMKVRLIKFESGKYCCPKEECAFTIHTLDLILKHLWEFHATRSCPVCREQIPFLTLDDLLSHASSHTGYALDECQEPGDVVFWDQIATDTAEDTFQNMIQPPNISQVCNLCGFQFSSLLKLTKHRWFVHGNTLPDSNNFYFPAQLAAHLRLELLQRATCWECGQQEQDLQHLATHLSVEHTYPGCFICFEKCSSINRLQTHLECHQQLDFTRENCPYVICKDKFDNLRDLVMHQWTQHGERRCLYCDVICESQVHFWNHAIMHNGCDMTNSDLWVTYLGGASMTYSQRCPLCSYAAPTADVLYVHIYDEHGARKCLLCQDYISPTLDGPDTFPAPTNISEYIQHMYAHQEHEKSLYCNQCGLKSLCPRDNWTHIQTAHRSPTDSPYHCDTCNQNFASLTLVTNHVNETHNRNLTSINKIYQCERCDLELQGRVNYLEHKRSHSDKIYSCEECGQCFLSRWNLMTHELIHTGVRPHKCEVCGKGFRRKDQLIIHGRIHSGYKPYSCKLCNKQFARSDNARKHEKRCLGSKGITCNECGKEFKVMENLTSHQERHKGSCRLQCQYCHKKMARSGSVRRHEIRCLEMRNKATQSTTVDNNTAS